MCILGIVGILIGLLIYTIVVDRNHINATVESKKESFFSGLRLAATNTQFWILSLINMLMYLPLVIIGDLWGIAYLKNVFNISETHAASIIALMFAGIAIGNPLFTTISDRISRRRSPLLIGAVLNCMLYLLLNSFVHLSVEILMFVFFLAGILLTANCLCWASVCESIPVRISGVGIGLSNMIVMSSGVIGHPLFGWLLNQRWEGAISNGLPIYTSYDYRFAFLMIPICLGVAIILCLFTFETYRKKTSVEYG